MIIIVNAESIDWVFPTITYYDLLTLTGKKGMQTMMVSYKKHDKKSRTIIEGDSLEVLEGMVFEVQRTDNA